ncbi:hypothetical protein KIN20_017619 [Parelaphostrongylus tenuis]|uniref:Uncharacterized protein n=1 Tax=Parelaphostrongylus tenuis TaxID=148309 RepID=A0AAD5N6J7_PARTN|nr:hypothetical protein KIN20_017619 [Parelaphostrongylus tenuis]
MQTAFSTDVQDSDIPFTESKTSPSCFYYAGYSGDVPRRQFLERCQKSAHVILAFSSVRLVSTIELDVHKHGTKIGIPIKKLSTLVVFEVCGREEDIDQLMSAYSSDFKKIPEHEQESFASVISHLNQLMLT